MNKNVIEGTIISNNNSNISPIYHIVRVVINRFKNNTSTSVCLVYTFADEDNEILNGKMFCFASYDNALNFARKTKMNLKELKGENNMINDENMVEEEPIPTDINTLWNDICNAGLDSVALLDVFTEHGLVLL